MFSFKAYFWNNNIYINGQYKYAANEILTAYLNSDYYEYIEEEDIIYNLERLKKKMIITEGMDYEYYENYSSNAENAIYLFSQINNQIAILPPYDKILQDQIYTFDDLLNKYSFFFDDGRDELHEDDPITWETVTPNGVGDCNSAGNFYIRLNKFIPTVLEDIEFYDGNMFADLQEMNREITNFFDGYIAFLKSYTAVHEIFKPFITEYLHRKETFISDNELARYYEEFKNKANKSFSGIRCIMNSFGYKVLKDGDGEPILCEEITFEDLQSFLYYDFLSGVKKNYNPNRCKLCGAFFLIRGGKYFSYCDRPLKDEPDKTCRDVGARRRYDDKCKNDPVWQTYNRAYKAHYARYLKKKMTAAQFEEWSRFASKLRDSAEAEKISFEDYYTTIRK